MKAWCCIVNESVRTTYRPLPDNLTIKPSNIEGLGLFATNDILEGWVFGISHIKDNRFEDGYIRTPLGGFFNHSDNPNCEAYKDGHFIKLVALRRIECGEEITTHYWLYDIDNKEVEKNEI